MSEQTSDELKTALRNALKASAAKPYFFALVTKGGDGALMVDKRKIPPAMVDSARKKVGSSSVVRGVCFGDADMLVFETARPPGGNLASLVRKVVQTQAGMSIKPEFRLGHGDDEAGADEQEADESPAKGGSTQASEDGSRAGTAKGNEKASADAAMNSYEVLRERVQLQARAANDAHSAAVAKVAPLLQLAAGKAKGGDPRAALQALQSVQAMLEKDATDRAAAMQTWTTRRTAVVTSLKSMAGKIAAAKHPSSGRAIVEIQSVIKNLTAEPWSLQQVNELKSWLKNDDVVSDVCELVEDIRLPLDEALEALGARFA